MKNKINILITGGAGFIGSNLAKFFSEKENTQVTIIDNFSIGNVENLKEISNSNNVDIIEGDIRDSEMMLKVIKRVDYISHQAALGSVGRSISNPLQSHDNNVNGFLNILESIRLSNKKIKLVYASSSSVYGDSQSLPKKENKLGDLLSPYALTKKINEYYANIYYKTYGISSIGLRYFNVFGPNQMHNNPYAAVIPIFCNCFITNQNPKIFGDGTTSRDFTYVENVLQANFKALTTEIDGSSVLNIGCGDQISLNELVNCLCKISKKNLIAEFHEFRPGDVKHSNADITKAKNLIGYNPNISFIEGLKKTYKWNKSR